MSNKEKNCLNRRIHWDRDGGCNVCRWEDKDHPSLFYQITQSPEIPAPNFVYHVTSFLDGLDKPKKIWYSTLITNQYFNTELEAQRATVAKLKEVAEGNGKLKMMEDSAKCEYCGKMYRKKKKHSGFAP